jgi:hypothetical protein
MECFVTEHMLRFLAFNMYLQSTVMALKKADRNVAKR